MVHLFVVCGFQGAEEDAEKLQLTDRLLQAVLAEAQVVCVGQPMQIAGGLNADPAVIPCLAKGISAGRYVDLALAYSLGAGLTPDVTCRFSREEGTGSRRISLSDVPMLLLHLMLVMSLIGDLLLTFSVLARFRSGAWMADVACPVACQPVWPACWLDTSDRSSSPSTRVVQDGDAAASRSSVDDFWSIWSRSAELGLYRAYSKAGFPTQAGSSAFLGRGLLRIRSRRLRGRAAGQSRGTC